LDELFDRSAEAVAAAYETDRALGDAEEVFVREAQLASEHLDGARDARCLDLGCGAGVIAATIAEHGYDIVGIDRSQRMIALAKRQPIRAGAAKKSVTFLQADAIEYLSSSRDTFSLVIASNV